MATIFIYYVLGFAAFLAVTYLCTQMGWLFEAEGRINWGGLAGLSIFLVCIFVFITFVCSVQLSGWQPPQLGIEAARRLKAQLKDVKILDSLKQLKDGGEQIADAVESVWEEHGNFGFALVSTQGATAMNMLIHDISEEGFLNRANPLNLINFRNKNGVGQTSAGDPAADAGISEEEKQRRADQEAFRIRVEAIEKQFNKKLKIPDTVLPEQLRRVEETYLAISTGEVKYPYLRFEFAFPRSQALNYLEKYEKGGAGQPVSVKIPVLMELFGEKFDLGLCTLNFSDVRVEPTLEKAKLMDKRVKIRIIPNQKPGQIVATYGKFKLSKTPSETQGSNPSASKV